mmetsp:Transcript_81317/g.170000  ORF Transcript_81317/g.170000 Transcript_81317/m.170000 type:complete len:204 (-) Transcript_81317:406-1017(-)
MSDRVGGRRGRGAISRDRGLCPGQGLRLQRPREGTVRRLRWSCVLPLLRISNFGRHYPGLLRGIHRGGPQHCRGEHKREYPEVRSQPTAHQQHLHIFIQSGAGFECCCCECTDDCRRRGRGCGARDNSFDNSLFAAYFVAIAFASRPCIARKGSCNYLGSAFTTSCEAARAAPLSFDRHPAACCDKSAVGEFQHREDCPNECR